eukprot:CAMPEP_0172836594 /NCGR_PEP_ID=MMETSP1075-20121228/26586_1 /TAXON_ID=2916 /ORGANISM="Ceratium fusus, Strain PA161109" /LENGTH=260 /DNA_ID=CAMNT_0013679841 /DNA_START=90 /DNA_END=872 /DNA_ORIENTATION=+
MAGGRERLQSQLDLLDPKGPPRVELTYGSIGDVEGPVEVAVLDSSFNPPTRSHLNMLSHAAQQLGFSRTLLLLAKQNADKPVVGAGLTQRLEMMQAIAESAEPAGSMLCGITAHGLFVDKAAALKGLFGSTSRIAMLVGFDTWIRIIDPKYYENDALDDVLRRIFDTFEVVVVSRDPSSASNLDDDMSIQEQERLVQQVPADITQKRLHFISIEPEMSAVSSSAVRKAVASGDSGTVRSMLPDCLHAYVDAEGLYMEAAV